MKKIISTLTVFCCILFLSACEGGGLLHKHDYTAVKYNETTHWRECECGEKTEAEEHNVTSADNKKFTCSVCNAECANPKKAEYVGEYLFHHIVRNLSSGNTKNYYIGDYYFGTTLSDYTIYAKIGNGVGKDSISYNFDSPVSVTCDFVILDDSKAVAYLNDTVDLFNDGNATDVLYFDITEVDGQSCFILKATHVQTVYNYYVRKSESFKLGTYAANGTADPKAASTEWCDASSTAVFSSNIWEPAYVVPHHIKITNEESIDLKYRLYLVANGEISKLAEVLDVYLIYPAIQVADRSALKTEYKLGTVADLLDGSTIISLGENSINAASTDYVTIAVKMQESAGNEYQNVDFDIGFSIRVVATTK